MLLARPLLRPFVSRLVLLFKLLPRLPFWWVFGVKFEQRLLDRLIEFALKLLLKLLLALLLLKLLFMLPSNHVSAFEGRACG